MYTKVKNNKLNAAFIFSLTAISLGACAPYYAPPPVAQTPTQSMFRATPIAAIDATAQVEHIPLNNWDNIPIVDGEVIDVPTSFNVNAQATPIRQQTMTLHDQTGRPYQVSPNNGLIAQQRKPMGTPHDMAQTQAPIPPWAVPFEQGDVSPALNRRAPVSNPAPAYNPPYNRTPVSQDANNSSSNFKRWVADGDRIFTQANLYTVKKGESVFQIMRTTGVHWEEIIRLNNLQPPFRLDVGQKLRLR